MAKLSSVDAATPTVVFVEDCDSDFELACVGIEQVKPEVTALRVSSGRDFLDYLAGNANPVSLFILDLSLPDVSGLALAKELRKSPSNAAAPIVIFSSSTNPRDAEAAKRCGADDYHVKPVMPGEFLRVVETIVSRWLPQIP
ncbi:MAG: response regulator [Aureliella sp.]|jgi:DNA-binding response OmpR family regulator